MDFKRTILIGTMVFSVGLAHPSFAAPAPTPTSTSLSTPSAVAVPKKPIYIIINKKHVFLPLGTKVPLELETYLSGNKSKPDEPVGYKVTADVHGPQGEVLIAKDAPAKGRVTSSAKSGGLLNKGSKLAFNAEFVTAVDGSQVPLIFEMSLQTKSGLGMTMVMGFGKGRNHKVKAGTKFEAVVGVTVPEAEIKTEDSGKDKSPEKKEVAEKKTDAKTK